VLSTLSVPLGLLVPLGPQPKKLRRPDFALRIKIIEITTMLCAATPTVIARVIPSVTTVADAAFGNHVV
jgi:hypothetical protein